jgi:hypothetical protein
MKYALLCYETPDDFATRDDSERQTAYRAAHAAYLAKLKQANVAIASVVGGAGLVAPHSATTLRLRGGSRQVLDGPYTDTKEALGGIYLIDVDNLDSALGWAEQCPTAKTGAMEVRPVMLPADQPG